MKYLNQSEIHATAMLTQHYLDDSQIKVYRVRMIGPGNSTTRTARGYRNGER